MDGSRSTTTPWLQALLSLDSQVLTFELMMKKKQKDPFNMTNKKEKKRNRELNGRIALRRADRKIGRILPNRFLLAMLG
jgi:hypothetical protein